MSSYRIEVGLAALACLAGCGESAVREVEGSMSGGGSHLVAVVDDSDPDFDTPPFTDTLSLYQYDSSATTYVPGATFSQLNVDQTVGGTRQLAVTADGTRIAVVSDLGRRVAVHVVEASAAQWGSLAVDAGSGIVWVAGGVANPVLNAYSADGALRSSMGGFSMSQKWVALVR